MPNLADQQRVPGRGLTGSAMAAQQAQATPKPPDQPWDYTPPPLTQPLPAPGGPIVQVVGAAPASAASPISSPAEATPGAGATPQPPYNPTNPQSPAQPVASPVAQGETQVAPSVTVTLTPDFKFDPAEVTIAAGQAVQWVNQGRSPQTVTSDPSRATDKSHAAAPEGAQPFDSGVLNASGSFVHTFDTAGTYSYFSMPQEANGMVGQVIVQ